MHDARLQADTRFAACAVQMRLRARPRVSPPATRKLLTAALRVSCLLRCCCARRRSRWALERADTGSCQRAHDAAMLRCSHLRPFCISALSRGVRGPAALLCCGRGVHTAWKAHLLALCTTGSGISAGLLGAPPVARPIRHSRWECRTKISSGTTRNSHKTSGTASSRHLLCAPAAMAQQWWALDELGDLGELDALLSSATAACDAGAGGDAAPLCARATTSGAPLTPSEAAPDACAQPAGGEEASERAPAVSGDDAGEAEAPNDSHQSQNATPARSGEDATDTRRLRCLDERHPPTCARCARRGGCGGCLRARARACRCSACRLCRRLRRLSHAPLRRLAAAWRRPRPRCCTCSS